MKRVTRWKSWRAIVLGFVAVTLGGFRSNAWSEDIALPPSLEQRVNILERKLELAQEEAAVKAKDAAVIKADKDGFQISSADKSFVLKFHTLFQADGRFFINDKAGNETDQFLLRRVRPSIEGTVYRDFGFVISPDFANNGSTVLYDAYLDIQPWSAAKLRVGKFKPPIGFEHLQSDPYTLFPERSFVSLLVPSRDTGLQLSGEFANGALGYAFAFTNGIGDSNATGDTDTSDGKEGTARFYAKPFKDSGRGLLQGLHLGLGGSYAQQNTAGATQRSIGQQAIFVPSAAAVVDGEKIRLAPELAWFCQSIGVLGEWAQSSQVYRVGIIKTRIVNQAWQAAASYVLTGEDASYTGVKPRKPFDPRAGQWGAWQVAARYHVLYVDPDIFTAGIASASSSIQRASAYGLGVNWFLNNAVRISTEYEQTTFDKGAALGNRPNEKVVISRWQLLF